MKKIAIFGYGSLVDQTDAERTLKRPIEAMHEAALKGWIREWSIVQDNRRKVRRFETVPDHSVPPWVLALNVRRDASPTSSVNGVLIPCTAQDLKWMDLREAHYTRVEVTADVTGGERFKHVYTYVGKEEHLSGPSQPDAIVPKSYVDLVENGFRAISEAALEAYRSTTAPLPHAPVPTIHT